MTTASLIADLARRGVRLAAVGDRLRVRAPAAVVTPALREELARRKAELLAALATANGAATPRTGPAPRALERTADRFHYSDGLLDFGDVPAGWLPARWAIELRRKSDCCDQYRADIADYYRRWAADIEQRLLVDNQDGAC